MPSMLYRQADKSDIPAMARIRAAEWESEEYWKDRISGYLNGKLHPRQALMPRVIYVALEDDSLVGFVAGHLTRRYACHGELEWIDIMYLESFLLPSKPVPVSLQGDVNRLTFIFSLLRRFSLKKAKRLCPERRNWYRFPATERALRLSAFRS